MKNLIFVGGIQCSGKSYLVNRLIKKNTNYIDLGFDKLESRMGTNAVDFFKYVTLLNPDLTDKLEKLGVNFSSNDLAIEQQLLKERLFVRDEAENWTRLIQESLFTYLAKTLLDGENESIPILESLFYF